MLPFAAATARLNLATIRRLGNARAQLAAGPAFTVIFDSEFVNPLGIEAARPAALCLAADVSSATAGARIVIDLTAGEFDVPGANAIAFSVIGRELDDGLVRLLLGVVL